MPPKKNAPRNAFYFFMIDYRDRMRDMGVNIPNGLQGVAEEASPEWRTMSAEQKQPFELLAKQTKSKVKNEKYTSQGLVLSNIEREQNLQLQLQNNILSDIEVLVKTLGNTYTLDDYNFHFIHMNYYCKVDKGKYIPCELALSEFNLRRGVVRVYHTFIDPKQIPIGYAFIAKSHSEDTHKIPMPPLDDAEGNYSKIFHIIKNFLDHESKEVLPPLFTMNICIESVKSFLSDLSDSVGYSQDLLRVYPLEKLFYELRNACKRNEQDLGFPAMCLAEEELERDIYDYTKGISCELHEANEGVKHCSLSLVRRWGFTLAEHCVKKHISFIPGQHCPLGVDMQGYEKQQERWGQAARQFETVKTNMHKEKEEIQDWFVPDLSIVEHKDYVPVRRPYTISSPESIPTQLEFVSGQFSDLNVNQEPDRVFEQSEFPSLGSRNVTSVGRGNKSSRKNVAERLLGVKPGHRESATENVDSYAGVVDQQASMKWDEPVVRPGIARGRATSVRAREERPGGLGALKPMGRGSGMVPHSAELDGNGGNIS